MTANSVENGSNLWTLEVDDDYRDNKKKEFLVYTIDEAPYLHTGQQHHKTAGQSTIAASHPRRHPRALHAAAPVAGCRPVDVTYPASAPHRMLFLPATATRRNPMTDQPRCPVCQHPATSTTHRKKAGVAFADCICPNEHLWSTHWLLPIVPLDPLPDQEAS